MRLTAAVVLQSPSFLNAMSEYELDLRGLGVAALQNLGATRDQYDTLDLSDNVLARLDNVPRLPRLCSLVCVFLVFSGVEALFSLPSGPRGRGGETPQSKGGIRPFRADT